MKNIYIIALFISLFLITSNLQSQTYVNKEWVNSTGSVGTYDSTASVLDNNENLIVVSNTLNSSNNTDVLVTKYDPDGIVLWQTTFDGSSNGNDYAVQVKVNSNNDIFVASTIYGTSNNDFGILKYNTSGTLLWSNTWNGSANGIDIPTDIDIDDNGNIYLVGGTEASNNMSDYAIVKFKDDGTFDWNTNYDYNNLHDGATSIKFDNNSVIVTGASASTVTEWDFATLKINASTGAILNTERTTITGAGLDNALAVATDLNNNIYITGYIELNENRNIQTVKLNSSFNLEWIRNFNGAYEDIANDIAVDALGNVFVTGSTENENGGKDCITIKYNSQGVQLWVEKIGSSGGMDIAKSEKLAITSDGGAVIVGSLEQNGNNNFIIVKYDANGNRKFSKHYGLSNENNQAKTVSIHNNNIYVSGVSDGTQRRNTTLKYSTVEKSSNIATTNGIAYNQNEVIIRFNRSQIIYSAIDKKDFSAGSLSDFVNASGLTDLGQATEMSWDNFPTFKIHRRMTTADSTSVSRSGRTIRIPDHWATLSVFIPSNLDI